MEFGSGVERRVVSFPVVGTHVQIKMLNPLK